MVLHLYLPSFKLKDMRTAIEEFRIFAENKLAGHVRELFTRYKQDVRASADIVMEAFKIHRNTFARELDEKKESLLKSDNPRLNIQLEKLKDTFKSKLSFDRLESYRMA